MTVKHLCKSLAEIICEVVKVKLTATNIRLQFNESRQPEIVLTINRLAEQLNSLKDAVSKNKTLDVEIKQRRERRSLDSNAYLWVLLQKLAEVLNSSKDEIYHTMLERYGQFTHIIAKAEAADKVMKTFKVYRNLGPVIVNGVTGIQIQCYFGSSSYNSKEMATLIEGVVSECNEVGIETLTPDELANMNKEWGRREV